MTQQRESGDGRMPVPHQPFDDGNFVVNHNFGLVPTEWEQTVSADHGFF